MFYQTYSGPSKDVGLFQLSHNGFFVFNLDKIENSVMGKCHFTQRSPNKAQGRGGISLSLHSAEDKIDWLGTKYVWSPAEQEVI